MSIDEEATGGIKEVTNDIGKVRETLEKRWEIRKLITGDVVLNDELRKLWGGRVSHLADKIQPIIEQFDGRKTTYTEQVGLQIGKKSPTGKAITIIVGTHNNETAGFDAVRLLLEKYPDYAAELESAGHQINILFGGQKVQSDSFFAMTTLMKLKNDQISASGFAQWRESLEGENYNRVPRTGLEQELSYLQQKYQTFQKYYEISDVVLDCHTTSMPTNPIANVYGFTEEAALEHKTLLAKMGAETVVATHSKVERPTLPMSTRLVPEKLDTCKTVSILFESGGHLDPEAGKNIIRAVDGLLSEKLGISISPKLTQPLFKKLAFQSDMALLYAPNSKNAKLNLPHYERPDRTLATYLVASPPLPEHPRWDDTFHLISAQDALPKNIQNALKQQDLIVREGGNGASIHKGEVIGYTEYFQEHTKIPVFMLAPCDGREWMAAQHRHIPQAQDGTGDDTSVLEITQKQTIVTVDLRNKDNGHSRQKGGVSF